MANIKSAQKRILVTEKKTLQNKMQVSAMKTAIKKFNASIAAKDVTNAKINFANAISKIDSVCSKGCIHKNNANRKKSHIAKKFDALVKAQA